MHIVCCNIHSKWDLKIIITNRIEIKGDKWTAHKFISAQFHTVDRQKEIQHTFSVTFRRVALLSTQWSKFTLNVRFKSKWYPWNKRC